ncbi:MAG TPA: molybdopterin-dependent oxidoreductase [Syntrophorhabdaceae bacterium]|nr:molybdopterin-dependent oxidoreductase [Syntrophorhabdaceae bacterium]HPP07137.1 molybdopterin-dependent oxidoreductase [Syntrophorhabdaceae bacterium]
MDGLNLTRRDFVRFLSVLGACLFIPCKTLYAKEVKKMLTNEDKKGFYVRFINPIEPLDHKTWRLEVAGLCENPLSFTLNDLKRLKKSTQTSRLKCVESWSSKAKWGGFRPEELFSIVRPKKEAKYVYFYSADEYYEFIPMEDLLSPRTIFAYEMNGAPLPDEHGAPLRLIIPPKYGYKSVKTILKIKFVEKEEKGYWANWGYSNEATVQPGWDYALDLDRYIKVEEPGELKY